MKALSTTLNRKGGVQGIKGEKKTGGRQLKEREGRDAQYADRGLEDEKNIKKRTKRGKALIRLSSKSQAESTGVNVRIFSFRIPSSKEPS